MSSIDVIFEVLPEEGPGDRSASQVWEELQHQLADPRSTLRSGDFARYAAQAELSGPGPSGDLAWAAPARGGLGPPEQDPAPEVRSGGPRGGAGFGAEEAAEVGPPPPPPSLPRAPGMESVFQGPVGSSSAPGGGSYVSPPTSLWGPQGPYEMPGEMQARYGGGGDWQGAQALSNAELVDKIARYEQQLARTAAGGPDPGSFRSEPTPPAPRSRGGTAEIEVQALEEKCLHYQQRLEAAERELRETQESLRTYRGKAEQLELKLKDREQLLVHAKEMWMKENVRASKLADALTSAEDKLADQERRLGEVAERYGEAQQEVRQLQHLLGSGGDSGAGFAEALPPEPAGRPPASAVDASFGGELLRGPGRTRAAGGAPGMPASRPDSADLAGGTALPPPPHEADTNADRFRRLCLLNDAVLYEDELLQIGVKAEYVGREGQFAVFFGNKGSAALQAFTVQYFVREEQALKVSASPLSQQLDADKQVVQRVCATCIEPFVHPVWLRVQFLLPDTSPRRIQLRFPIVLTKYMVGCELSAADFFRHWRQQNFVLNEVTNVVHLAARLRGQLVYVARSIVFGGALRLHHGIDTNPDNFVLVARLAGVPEGSRERQPEHHSERGLDALGFGRDEENGLSLIRVEVGTGRFTGKARVVVRSSDHTISRALCDCIVIQLAEPNTPQSSEATAR